MTSSAENILQLLIAGGFVKQSKVDEARELIASLPSESLKPDDSEEFSKYMTSTREAFIKEVGEQEWNTELRKTAENMIICFDQMRDRLADAMLEPESPVYILVDIVQKLREMNPYKYANDENYHRYYGWDEAADTLKELIEAKEEVKNAD